MVVMEDNSVVGKVCVCGRKESVECGSERLTKCGGGGDGDGDGDG